MKTAPIRDALHFLLEAVFTELPVNARIACKEEEFHSAEGQGEGSGDAAARECAFSLIRAARDLSLRER